MWWHHTGPHGHRSRGIGARPRAATRRGAVHGALQARLRGVRASRAPAHDARTARALGRLVRRVPLSRADWELTIFGLCDRCSE
jgi:hypothetical protein